MCVTGYIPSFSPLTLTSSAGSAWAVDYRMAPCLLPDPESQVIPVTVHFVLIAPKASLLFLRSDSYLFYIFSLYINPSVYLYCIEFYIKVHFVLWWCAT
jgi:hypothetical protein